MRKITCLGLALVCSFCLVCNGGPEPDAKRIRALVERFCNGSVVERVAAKDALLRCGRAAWPYFRELIHDDDPDVRRRARLIWIEIVTGGRDGWSIPARDTPHDPRSGLPMRVFHRKSGVAMALILPGRVRVGDRWIVLTAPLYMGVHEVTEADYGRGHPDVMYFLSPERGRKPMANVSLVQIRKFLRATGLDLPTGAEWEFAYHSGGVQPAPEPAIQSHAAGTTGRNGLGLHDMRGNLAELCGDGFARGGSFLDNKPGPTKVPVDARAHARHIGFRVVRRMARTEYGR